MQNRYRQAREERRLSAVELAEKLEVHPSTVANWESGRRQITADKLLQMAGILDFSVDFLLGRDYVQVSLTKPVVKESLHAMHGQPVWAASHGWMLVNITKNAFILCNLSLIEFDNISEPIYLIPPALSISLRGLGVPLSVDAVLERAKIWLEPISADPDLAGELRGWYRMYEKRLAANEYGNRFYLDTYGVKWLAFDDCFGGRI